MRKVQQQIRCSSDVSIADRINSHPQVKFVFIPVISSSLSTLPPHFLTKSLYVILPSSFNGLMKLCPNPNLGIFFFFFLVSWKHAVETFIQQLLMPSVSVPSDSGSSSSEDEGPKRSAPGPGTRNGEVRKKRSRTPSPRRRHRDASPRLDNKSCISILSSHWFNLQNPTYFNLFMFIRHFFVFVPLQEKTVSISSTETSFPISSTTSQISFASSTQVAFWFSVVV